MVSKKKCRGSCLSRFIGFLFLVVVAFMLMGPLLRCAQQLPQMAGNAAAHAASNVGNAASSGVSSLGRRLLNGIKDWWDKQSDAEKFQRVCENLGVEGVDKLCPYFTAPLQAVGEAAASQTECYLTVAGTGTDGQQTLQTIQNTCPQTPGNVAGFQSCIQTYVQTHFESGDWASCMPQAPGQFAREVHTMIQPIACIPGLPKSWCDTSSSSGSSSTSPTSPPARTDANYVNCLQKYYQLLPMYNEPLTCGATVNAQNASCARGQLLNWTYQGQHYGVAQVQSCDGMPQQ